MPEPAFQALLAQHGARQGRCLAPLNVRVVNIDDARLDRVLEALGRNPQLEFVEPDYLLPPTVVPNDPYYSLEWHLPAIDAPAAWDMTCGSTDVIIAILDSGIDATHPDLAPKIVAGWNFNDDNADTSDSNGHGTAVAGQAAATPNNGVGVAAVAWNCRVMPIRVTDELGYGSTLAMANGLAFAADRGVRVANISFRASSSSTVRAAAESFQSRGGVVTIAAGNEGVFDSSADNPFALTVSATDSTDTLATFSNTGNSIDLAAPGVSVLTTTAGGGYGSGTGTSASAPIVAGVAALVISANPGLTGAQVQTILKESADDLGAAGWDTSYGWGRVNAARAVALALETPPGDPPPPSDTTPPASSITSPANGATVSGTVSVAVDGTDNVGVTKVDVYVNGALRWTAASAPAVFSWDTTADSNGSYSLEAVAYDAAGNSGTSTAITVTVNNPVPDRTAPTVRITSPTSGTTVTKSVKVYVTATDNVAVTRVDLLLDGKKVGTSTSAAPVFSLNTSKLAKGAHTLQALAFDAAGNQGNSATVTIYK